MADVRLRATWIIVFAGLRAGHLPPGLIHEHDGMGTRRHGPGDFGQMQGHRVGIADRQDKPCALGRGRADRSEDMA